MPNVPHVTNEWGRLRVAVMHPVVSVSGLTPFREGIAKEHLHIIQALRDFGVDVLELPRSSHPYHVTVFARDPVHVAGNELFRSHVNARSSEDHDHYKLTLEQWMGVSLPDQYDRTADGGDVLLLPHKKILIGQHHHPDNDDPYAEPVDDTSQTFAASMRDRGWYPEHVLHTTSHADCAVAPLPDGEVWVNMNVITRGTCRNIQRILAPHAVAPLPSSSEFGANILWLDPRTVMTADTQVAHALSKKGHTVIHFPTPCLERLGGSIRCCVGVLMRDDV